MALQAYNLTPKRTKKTNRVVANSFIAAIPNIEDLGRVVQEISAYEITKQIQIDNPPQNIIVDNSGSKPFNEADWRVTAYFANHEDMAKAAAEVVVQLRKLTRIGEKRAAVNSYEIWTVGGLNDAGTRISNATTSVRKLTAIAAKLPPGGRIVVVGPTVPYGRKLYWRPKGTFKGRASRKAAYDSFSGKTSLISGKRSTNMRDLVLGRVKRKHKGVLVIGRWVIMDGKRWPGIAIGLKIKGTLH